MSAVAAAAALLPSGNHRSEERESYPNAYCMYVICIPLLLAVTIIAVHVAIVGNNSETDLGISAIYSSVGLLLFCYQVHIHDTTLRFVVCSTSVAS